MSKGKAEEQKRILEIIENMECAKELRGKHNWINLEELKAKIKEDGK